MSEYLSDMQKERSEMLANKFMELNIFEMQYVQKLINQRFKSLTTLDLVNLNTNWPAIKEQSKCAYFILSWGTLAFGWS